MCGVVSMFVVGRELCLLRIEVLHFLQGRRFTDFRKYDLQSIFTPAVKITSSYNK